MLGDSSHSELATFGTNYIQISRIGEPLINCKIAAISAYATNKKLPLTGKCHVVHNRDLQKFAPDRKVLTSNALGGGDDAFQPFNA